MKNAGYTLLELVIATAIFVTVSTISIIAIGSTTSVTSIMEADSEVQANLRTAMDEMVLELRMAYTDVLVDASIAPEDVRPLWVTPDGTAITFQVPVLTAGEAMVAASTPITYRFENEDLPVGETGQGNALLDQGEDENGDGVLTRRIMRVQDGVEQIVGLPNEISAVQFILEENATSGDSRDTAVRIVLEGAKRFGGRSDNEVMRMRIESRVHVEN